MYIDVVCAACVSVSKSNALPMTTMTMRMLRLADASAAAASARSLEHHLNDVLSSSSCGARAENRIIRTA